MPVRNPSELQRLTEELDALKADLKEYWPKAHKEGILRQIRTIENILGLEHTNYNGGK